MKAAPIPSNVAITGQHELAVTSLPPDFSIRMEGLIETTIPAVKRMTAIKQEVEVPTVDVHAGVAATPPNAAVDGVEAIYPSNAALVWHPPITRRGGGIPRVQFDALPLTFGRQESSDEDETASMDTCDKENGSVITVYEEWEMRK